MKFDEIANSFFLNLINHNQIKTRFSTCSSFKNFYLLIDLIRITFGFRFRIMCEIEFAT